MNELLKDPFTGNRRAHVQSARLLAHDARNVSSRLYLVADELENSDVPRLQTLGVRVRKACDRMINICDGHIEPGKSNDLKTLGEVVDDVVQLAALAAGPQTLVKAFVSCEQAVVAKPVLIFRILANLTFNAVSAMNRAEKGLVFIRVNKRAGIVKILVEDSGLGGAPKSGRPGKGLGLLIALGLAEECGVELVCLRSGPDGTVFEMTLPKA